MTSQFTGTYRPKHAKEPVLDGSPNSVDEVPKDYKEIFDSRAAHSKCASDLTAPLNRCQEPG